MKKQIIAVEVAQIGIGIENQNSATKQIVNGIQQQSNQWLPELQRLQLFYFHDSELFVTHLYLRGYNWMLLAHRP